MEIRLDPRSSFFGKTADGTPVLIFKAGEPLSVQAADDLLRRLNNLRGADAAKPDWEAGNDFIQASYERARAGNADFQHPAPPIITEEEVVKKEADLTPPTLPPAYEPEAASSDGYEEVADEDVPDTTETENQ